MKKLSYLVLFFLLAIPVSAQNQFKLSSIPFLFPGITRLNPFR